MLRVLYSTYVAKHSFHGRILIVGVRSLINALFSFFFFQAEDGIRDLIVTGVQTCALPIFQL